MAKMPSFEPSAVHSRSAQIKATAAITVLVFFCISAYSLFGHQIIREIYDGGAAPIFQKKLSESRALEFYLGKADRLIYAYGALLFAACLTALTFLSRLGNNPREHDLIADIALFSMYCAIGYIYFMLFGYEGEWYRLETILSLQGAPPFQHRVLFIGVAHLALWVWPNLSTVEAFLASQMIALMLALWSVRLLCSVFLRKDLAFAGQFLMLAAWAPTVSYYTLYDLGIIAIYAIALYLIFTDRFKHYLIVLALGTYNHEITLFLIVAFALISFDRIPKRRLITLLITQLLIYALVRWSLFSTLPAEAAWEGGKVAKNMAMVLQDPARVLSSLGWTALLFAAALATLAATPTLLRRSVIVLPCLMFMTFVVGQLNEARQFDAFIPIFAALICAWIGRAIHDKTAAGSGHPAVR
jgi:hypothetical protein